MLNSHYRQQIESYFQHFKISIHIKSYRAMEVDKTLTVVEEILLNDFKQHAVARNEPRSNHWGRGVSGYRWSQACALFNRNTPHIMIGPRQ